LRKPGSRWEDKIKVYLTGRGRESMDWVSPEQDRGKWRVVVKIKMNIPLPKNAGNFLIS
jgi:hypothetical protein